MIFFSLNDIADANIRVNEVKDTVRAASYDVRVVQSHFLYREKNLYYFFERKENGGTNSARIYDNKILCTGIFLT